MAMVEDSGISLFPGILDEVTDVVLSNLIHGQTLIWNAVAKKWTNGTIAVSGGNGSTVWGSIAGTLSDQTDLQTLLNLKAPVSHTHTKDNITDFAHVHAIADVTDLQLALDDKSDVSHVHVISDVTGLQLALDNKASSSHTHTIANVTGLQLAIDGKTDVGHSHAISSVTGLQTALDGKALSSHTHVKADITDFAHTHIIGDVTGLQTALDSKQATITGAATTIVSSNLTASKVLVSDTNGKVSVASVSATELGYLANVTSAIQTQLNNKISSNVAITASTKTKITYDVNGLVTAGADATTADIASSLNKRYVTDAQLTVIGNTSNTNSGDETNATIKTKLGAATNLLDGYLTSVDWVTFNSKANASHTHAETDIIFTDILTNNVSITKHGYIPKLPNSTTQYFRGDGSWTVPPNDAAIWGSITGTLSNQSDLLSALNAKQNSLGFTAENTANKATTMTSPDNTKYPTLLLLNDQLATKANTSHSHIIGDVTGLQTALDGKQATITGAISGVVSTNLNNTIVVVTDGSGKLTNSTITTTKLGYLTDVTSAIQAQIDGKAASSHNQAETTITFTDVTTGDVSITKHGFIPKLPNNTTQFFRADGTWSVPPVGGAGTWGSITGVLSNQTDLQTALDGKQNSLGFTAENTANKATTMTSPDDTKYPTLLLFSNQLALKASSTHSHAISDVTGLQTALDGKQATITGAATTISSSNLALSKALISDASGKVAVATTTSTELNYVSGVTSSIQNQLDAKVAGNVAIVAATKTKITYDAKGLVTAGADATTADISDSTNKRYVTDAHLVILGNTSNTNSGDETQSTIKTKLGAATNLVDGYLTTTDWNTFNNKMTGNTAVTGATKTKITFDAKGLVTAGTDATTADIADSTNKRYVTDAHLVILGNTSNTNTGDETNATIKSKLGAASTSNDGYLTTAAWDAFSAKLTGNIAITAGTKTKITYDTKGLVTAGADATTADIADSTNKRYVTDAHLTILGNTSNTNTGDETTGTIQTKLGTATTSTSGYLTSTDWNTFNGKQNRVPTQSTYAPASGSQTVALNVSANNMHVVSGNASGTAMTFTITGASTGQVFIVSILQGGTTLSTIAGWFATVRWAGGSAPTLTATLNKRDTFGFICTGSNTYDGFIIGQNA